MVPNIPDHTSLNIKFTLHAIDSWDSETFYLYADGVLVYEETFSYTVGEGNDCGNVWLERDSEISINVAHTASTLEVYMSSNLNEDAENESWGLSNFIVEYVTDDECVVYEDLSECNADVLASAGNVCPLFNAFDQFSA